MTELLYGTGWFCQEAPRWRCHQPAAGPGQGQGSRLAGGGFILNANLWWWSWSIPCALSCSYPQSFVTWSWLKGPNPSLCIGCCWALPARGSARGPCSNLGGWMGLGRWGRRRQDRAFYAFISTKKAVRCWGRTGAPGQAPAAHSSALLGLGMGRPRWRAREAESEQNTPALEEPVI